MKSLQLNLILDLIEQNEWYDKYMKIVSADTTESIFHEHHIIPRAYYRHLGIPVDNTVNNLVRLTPEQHVLAHYYLAQCSSEPWFKRANYASVLYMCGVKKSELTEEAVKESAKRFGALNAGISNPAHREVYQYELSGKLVKKWNTVIEASRNLGLDENHISSCAAGKRKSSGGYMWSYSENICNEYVNDRYVKVYQYDLDGNLIAEYPNTREAARTVGLKGPSTISACCKGKRKQCRNSLWSYEKSDIMKYERGATTKRRVAQYDLNDKLIKIFDSISEASKNTGAKNIYYCCLGKRKKSNGFKWRFIDE